MKRYIAVFYFLAAVLVLIPSAAAQAKSLKTQSLNGATGLYSIPSGHIGWTETDVGLDVGYRAILNENGNAHVPAVTVSLIKWIELSGAFDIQQPKSENYDSDKNNDLLLGMKIRLPTNTGSSLNPAISVGGNMQIINLGNDDYSYNAYQPYAAVTYSSTFFNMKSETTLVFGKTFYTGDPNNNSNVDFGMGFDLILFPDVFKDIVHWIIDFANFNYGDNSWPNYSYYHSNSAFYRGIINSGFRIDLSSIPALNKFKFSIDLVFNDLFDDDNRSFIIGGVFGLPAK